jgi:hypothetical protein
MTNDLACNSVIYGQKRFITLGPGALQDSELEEENFYRLLPLVRHLHRVLRPHPQQQ